MKSIQRRGCAFTLVELIVVITILAILWTISLIALQSYAKYSRDVVRTSDMWAISRAISIKIVQWGYAPKPDNPVEITSSGTLVMYQWTFAQAMWERYGVSWSLKDPLDNKNYTYTTDKNLLKHELGGFLEWDVAYNDTIVPQTYAFEWRRVITKGDKLGIFYNTDDVPIQELFLSWNTLDIVKTNDVYRVYFDNNDVIEGTWTVLYEVNPRGDCTRLFELANWSLGSWEYNVINPYWENLKVFCDIRLQDQTFYRTIVDGDMENRYSENWDAYTKVTGDSRSGDYSLKFPWWVHPTKESKNYTYVLPGESYVLEWYFKSVWSIKSRIYYGFKEYDKDFKLILNNHVNAKPWTETTLNSPVSPNDTEIHFDCDDALFAKWNSYLVYHSRIAFDVDDSWAYNDLPNRNQSWAISNSSYRDLTGLLVKNWNVCTLKNHPSVWRKAWVSYPAWTKIRFHSSGGTYNYRAASSKYVPYDWTRYAWEVKWISQYGTNPNYFRRGTKFIKILLLTNYQQDATAQLLIDDMELVEE